MFISCVFSLDYISDSRLSVFEFFFILAGAKIYFACRSRSRAEQAIRAIQKETGVPDDRLSIILLDLASLKSVREFVREFTSSKSAMDFRDFGF